MIPLVIGNQSNGQPAAYERGGIGKCTPESFNVLGGPMSLVGYTWRGGKRAPAEHHGFAGSSLTPLPSKPRLYY